MNDPVHCDEAIHDHDHPVALRYFLLVHRLPAIDKAVIVEKHGRPICYATHKGKRVRLVMASRFGDVGITRRLSAETGYDHRVSVCALSDFSADPEAK